MVNIYALGVCTLADVIHGGGAIKTDGQTVVRCELDLDGRRRRRPATTGYKREGEQSKPHRLLPARRTVPGRLLLKSKTCLM